MMRAICLLLPLLLTSAGSNPSDGKCLVDVGESLSFVIDSKTFCSHRWHNVFIYSTSPTGGTFVDQVPPVGLDGF